MGRHLSNLPAEVTSFVGRRQELREVKRLLTTTRLLTLTGSGGVGKTKLALRAAAEMSRGFPDGAWLVLLDSVRDPLLVTQAVFGALGVHDLSSGLSLSSLADYLAGKRLLLVLDNCEHLLDACAVLAGTLHRRLPGPARAGHQPAGSRRRRRGPDGRAAHVAARRGGRHLGAKPARLRLRVAAERACRGGQSGLHRRCGQRRAGPALVPEAGRHPAGAGAGRGPAGFAEPGAAERGPGQRTVDPGHGEPRRRGPPADAGGDDRLELRPAGRAGTAAVGPAVGVRRRVRGRRGDARSAPMRGFPPGGSPACSGRWWTSPS